MTAAVKIGPDGYFESPARDPAAWRAAAPDQPAGRVIANATVPPGFFMVQNYIDRPSCARLTAACDAQPGVRHTINVEDGSLMTRVSAGRTSECIDADALGSINLTDFVRSAWRDAIGPHYRAQIESFERPEILRYRAGGEYRPHADADNWIKPAGAWRRTVDRDLSLLLYLNDDFTGGEIVFYNFGMSLKPAAGLLIAFPSDYRYLHSARPVQTGVRYAVVSWAAVRGRPRVETAPRAAVIQL
jgi:predicted 2-oxoglutarate/Fe(II)-dependent dioxygenase YbiX